MLGKTDIFKGKGEYFMSLISVLALEKVLLHRMLVEIEASLIAVIIAVPDIIVTTVVFFTVVVIFVFVIVTCYQL